MLNAHKQLPTQINKRNRKCYAKFKVSNKNTRATFEYTLIVSISRMDWHQTDNWDVDSYEWKEQAELLYFGMGMLSRSQIQAFCHI